jgi:hypothetical protein
MNVTCRCKSNIRAWKQNETWRQSKTRRWQKKLSNNGGKKTLTKLKIISSNKNIPQLTKLKSQWGKHPRGKRRGEISLSLKKIKGLQEVAVGIWCLQPNPKSTLDAPWDPDLGKGSDLTQFLVFCFFFPSRFSPFSFHRSENGWSSFKSGYHSWWYPEGFEMPRWYPVNPHEYLWYPPNTHQYLA